MAGVVERTRFVDSCAREPIHIIGHIQSHGLLFALSEPDFIVRQVSTNMGALLNISPDVVLGSSFEAVLGARQFDTFRTRLRTDDLIPANPLRVQVGNRALEMNCVAHRHDRVLIAEFEPVKGAHSLEPLTLAANIQALLWRLEKASDILDLSQVAASELRRLSGFDRVMVYRFDADWNGEVIAAAVAPSTVSYLGHRFPASDIPAQARQLFIINPLRAIADVGSTPVPIVPEIGPLTGRALDLTHSFLRSASPVHIEFLRNWGVQASMTVSIIVEQQLWGMLALQHFAPRKVDCSIRSICEMIGRNLGLQVGLRTSIAARQARRTARELFEDYMAGIEASKSVAGAESFPGARFLDLFDADGLVSRIDGIVSSHGVTVAEQSLLPVIAKLRKSAFRDIASSNGLGAIDQSAKSYASNASGALHIGLSEMSGDYLLFLRRELVETVTWAGNPDKAVSADVDGKLHPRTSFAAWQETVRGRSRPWTELELDNARLLRGQLLHLRDAQKLREFEERVRQSPPL